MYEFVFDNDSCALYIDSVLYNTYYLEESIFFNQCAEWYNFALDGKATVVVK